MRPRSNDRSFEESLERAVRDMHQNTPRGDRPPDRVWNQIAVQAGIPDQNDDIGKPENTRSGTGTPAPNPRAHTKAPVRARPGWSTWLAAALVVVLVGASVNFLMPEDNDGNTTSEDSIALAPGTPDMSVFSQLQVATPMASPELYTPVHGPEYACHAEPLTEDQVFDIVMNPSRERVRRGSETQGEDLENTREDNQWVIYQAAPNSEVESFEPVDDPDQVQLLVDTSNQFWNCLMTGTAFQVWALIDPANVQEEILRQYPVIRDEATLRQHIAEWGPRRYSAALTHTFPDFGNVDPIEASTFADESYGSITIWHGPYGDGENSRARVVMLPHPESSRAGEVLILLELVQAADGTWWATSFSYKSP